MTTQKHEHAVRCAEVAYAMKEGGAEDKALAYLQTYARFAKIECAPSRRRETEDVRLKIHVSYEGKRTLDLDWIVGGIANAITAKMAAHGEMTYFKTGNELFMTVALQKEN